MQESTGLLESMSWMARLLRGAGDVPLTETRKGDSGNFLISIVSKRNKQVRRQSVGGVENIGYDIKVY